jgi:peptide deformylase
MARVHVAAQDLAGRALDLHAEGLLAIVLQHEMDHLDGRLIVDWVAQGCKSWREEDLPEDHERLD